MAIPGDLKTLCIKVLEDCSDSPVFTVQVHCKDPILLDFWLRKAFFYNGQVEQTDVLPCKEGEGLEFVLRVMHRSRRLCNAHYWSPFVVALCLDALLFRYRLPPQLHWNGNIQEVMEDNALTLTRSEEPHSQPDFLSPGYQQ